MNDWLAARNILAIRPDNIGDVIMLGPALRAIKETSLGARITLLASTGGATGAPLLPWVDEVIPWRTLWQDLGHLAFDPARERALIDTLAGRHFDAALCFTSFSQSPHPPGYVCYLAGIPLRAGESKEFGGRVLTTELRGVTPDEEHQAERNLRLVEAVGFVTRDRHLAIRLTREERAAVPGLLRGAGIAQERPFVVLHPGASAEARRYPPARSGELARALRARDWQVLVTGVEREAAIVETVLAAAPGTPALVGGTSLSEYAALIERAALVICGNTLPLHLADAVGTPVLALYSGTDHESQWQPRVVPHRILRRPTPCYPCYRFSCPIGQPCLDIPATEVADEAEALITRAEGRCGAGVGAYCIRPTHAGHTRALVAGRGGVGVCNTPLRPTACSACRAIRPPRPQKTGGPGALHGRGLLAQSSTRNSDSSRPLGAAVLAIASSSSAGPGWWSARPPGGSSG
jgi:ADP-heptose:LPS heptosyltransferase